MNKKKFSIIIVVITFVLIIAWVLYSLNEFNDDKNDYAPTDSDASEPIGTLMYTSDEADYPTFSVYRINKIAGTSYSWDSEDGISVKNNKYLEVAGTDLGAITKCGDKFYLNFGDTLLENITYTGTNPNFPANQAENNFFVAFSNSTNIEDLTFDGYIASGDRPSRALLNCHNVGSGGEGGCYTIPNAMFSVLDSNGQCVGLFSQYMDVNTVGGHNHKSYASYIAKMDWNDSGLFKDYKGNDYKWSIAGAPNERYDFTMASFVQKGDYIYMFGSPAGRFGGLKVARIETSKFLNTTDLDGWEYFTNDNQWVRSKDLNFIKNSAKWVISPKDSNYTYFKNYADGQEAIQNMTIAEFSVVYNPYLGKYLLMTGRPDSTLGVYMYLADQPQGPWEEKILMPNKSRSPKSGTWTYYGTYTTSSLLKDNGKTMYFLATTWQPYGVYVYRVDFSDTEEPCTPNCVNKCGGSDGCGGTCQNTCTGATPQCKSNTTCVECLEDSHCTGGKTCNNVGQCVDSQATIDIDIDGVAGVSMGDYSAFVLDYLAFRRRGEFNERSDFVKSTPNVIDMADYQAFVLEYLRLRRL